MLMTRAVSNSYALGCQDAWAVLTDWKFYTILCHYSEGGHRPVTSNLGKTGLFYIRGNLKEKLKSEKYGERNF